MGNGILRWLFPALLLALGSSPLLAQQRNLAVERSDAALAEKRVALVIGNSAYSSSPLKNPVNDAKDMAAKLRTLGFDVIERTNLSVRQIGRTLSEFRGKLVPGAVALVFYAGHGLQIKGDNYLPTVDADISVEEDVPNQSLAVKQILDILENAKTRLNLVFLDACRNNPYARSFRGAGDGLARVAAPSGTLISFATRPGSVAADGDGRNGLYTQYLLGAMDTPNLSVEQVIKRVVSGVKVASRGRQEPWMEGSIEGEFYFTTAAQPAAAFTDIAQLQQQATERANKAADARLARDRTEMQASMEKMLNDALAKQKALLETERMARLAAVPSPVRQPEPVPSKSETAVQPAGKPIEDKPLQLALLPPPRPVTGASPAQAINGPTLGDEWEYVATDNLFSKKRSLIERVAAVVEGKGVLEQIVLDGKEIGHWALDGKPVLLGTSSEIGLLYGSHWIGADLSDVPITNWGVCRSSPSCKATGRIVGKEKITVPAGTFDTTRIEFELRVVGSGSLVVWYSDSHKRIVKQRSVYASPGAGLSHLAAFRFDDTIELSAIRHFLR